LTALGSTPDQVGPGTYTKLGQKLPVSHLHDNPTWSFPKDKKHRPYNPDVQKNQTYDTRRAIGNQITSQKKTMPQISFGKAKRDVHTGTFRDTMSTQPTRVRIQCPKF